jgi:phosphoglycolate phosphatase-like HAD superfamily hydrolase
VGVEDTPWKKPQPEMTHYALEKLGVTARETLLVGDSPFDVATARAAGLKVCLVPTGTHSREQLVEEKPDWLVKSLRDVVAIVERGS